MNYFLQKTKTILDMLRHPFFAYIKITTKGYLYPSVYRALYDSALTAPEGHAIDIGPAQGGSTIAISTAYKHKKSLCTVYSIEKGKISPALSDNDNIDLNRQVLEDNLKRFNVEKQTCVIMEYSHEAFINAPIPEPIALLSIDADGGLDRDFNIFYNNLAPGAQIILDDVENIINRHGKKLLSGNESDIEKHITDHNVDTLAAATPLGKEILTYRFVEYLIAKNLLIKDKIVGSNTFFGHTPVEKKMTFTEEHFADMQKIRKEIEHEFLRMRTAKKLE